MSQSVADTHLSYYDECLPRSPESQTQYERTEAFPAHAQCLYHYYRNVFMDVYLAGYLNCTNYIGRDELQKRLRWHLHALGSDGNASMMKDFRDALAAFERRRVLGDRNLNGEEPPEEEYDLESFFGPAQLLAGRSGGRAVLCKQGRRNFQRPDSRHRSQQRGVERRKPPREPLRGIDGGVRRARR